MDGSSPLPGRRTLTPAVLGSAAFVVACAVIAITFVAARGGLQMPVAPSGSEVAVASDVPSAAPSEPAATIMTPTASPPATPGSTLAPTAAPTPTPTAAPVPTPEASPDPLTALPGCPGQPGCYEYLIRPGDTLSGVASRYLIPVSTVLALNPELTDPSTIVLGQILYLGRDPFARLEPCPDAPDCSLYVVRPGDRLSTVAGRFGLTVEVILEANPTITDANAIYSGQVVRLPRAGP